jgi:hypothetical protein
MIHDPGKLSIEVFVDDSRPHADISVSLAGTSINNATHWPPLPANSV